ncbi:SixA phosphatase family protein [Microbacterium elymi]|uniref:Histidine phosphatase family protein n=1 Tax=Microbacterium elymi TaxID=2909587 RepID=A0ABY5NKE8_9MICO|nr:histidine phosphatase family protein [Microbacterium elymi]UUT35635.1 histidine phosphatase family protein [Microbacterium elymi]
MKVLALVRHAKSDWTTAREDHDRPLNDRGCATRPGWPGGSPRPGLRPDVILSSTALRARTTAEAFAAELGVAVDLEPELYGAPAERCWPAPPAPGPDRSWWSRTTPV